METPAALEKRASSIASRVLFDCRLAATGTRPATTSQLVAITCLR